VTPPTEGTGLNALEAAVLRIRDERGEPVGVGFLVSDELAFTCAHVVSRALHIPEDAEPPASARLHVDLPLLPAGGGGTDVTASIERWVAPLDVAVLRLTVPPAARPIRLVDAPNVWEHPARAFGFPPGRSGGVWHSGVLRARQADGWVQADLEGEGYRVSEGFSGTPVWDEKLFGVVGMVVVAEPDSPSVSYLIPTRDLLAAYPGLRELALAPSPFRSLSAFQEADAAVFHGRATEAEELAAALAAERWVTVVGPSGSGKSSLAMAGVIPRLREAGASAVVLRPAAGDSPLSALAAALLPLLEPELPATEQLARIHATAGLLRRRHLTYYVDRLLELQGTRRLLVVVDQFEELLALAPEAVDELASVLYDDALPDTVRVLTTLRTDFLEPALAHPRLGPALSRRVHALGPLGPERLREVVTAPVEAIPGVRYEPHLASRILDDTGTEPGSLPLLGFTLDLLWQLQHDGLLTHRAYEELGAVAGALGAYAERVWAGNVADEAVARRLLTQLIRVPIGLAAATRRVATRGELGEDGWRAAQRLATTRLLVIGRSAEGTETVELAHEALITGWARLAAWVAEDRSFLIWRESLRHDMDRWERGERAFDLLPTAAALVAAQRWQREHGTDLSDAERDYLERGRRHRRSRARRRRLFLSGLGIVMVLALVFGTLLAFAQRESRQRQALANSRALTQAAQDEAANDPAQAAMLAMAAYQTAPTQEARNELLRQYLRYTGTTRVLSGLLGQISRFQASRDGNVVFATSALGRALLFVHAVTGTVRSEQLSFPKQVVTVALSADGRRAGFLTVDGAAYWFNIDPGATRPIGPLHKLPDVPGDKRGFAISPDGRMLAVTLPGRLVWWDLGSGTIGGTAPAPADTNGDLWIAPDDRHLLAGTGLTENASLTVIDMVAGRTRRIVAPAHQIMLPSGDRTAVVVCREHGDQVTLTLRRATDGTPLTRPYRSKDATTCEAADATGRRVVLGDGTTLHLVDLDRRTELSKSRELEGIFFGSPNLVSAGGRSYLVSQGNSQIAFTPVSGQEVFDVNQQILTADGSKVISVIKGGSHLLLERTAPDDDQMLAEAPRPRPYWLQDDDRLVLSRDGGLFADREGPNVVSIREVSTLRQVAQVTTAKPPQVTALSFHFDGAGHLVTTSGTQIQQWDLRSARQVARFDAGVFHPTIGEDGAPSIAVGPYPAPDRVAVVVDGDPVIHVVDIRTGRTTAALKTTNDAIAIRFDSTGRYFVLLRHGSILELWRRHPLRRELGPLRSVSDSVDKPFALNFLDDKGRLLLAANDAIRIYQVGRRAYQDSYNFGQPPGNLFALFPQTTPYYSFIDAAANGKVVLYTNAGGLGGALFLDPALWQRKLCGIIGNRSFTTEERASLPVPVPAEQICQ
jgi:hypothetical protein